MSLDQWFAAEETAISPAGGTMTPKEENALRVRIAALCPNVFIHVPSPFGPGGLHWKEGRADHGHVISPGAHVDPLSDLNACAEMEKMLTTTSLQNAYQSRIAEICYADHDRANNQVVFNQLTATATQRCRAFILCHSQNESR